MLNKICLLFYKLLFINLFKVIDIDVFNIMYFIIGYFVMFYFIIKIWLFVIFGFLLVFMIGIGLFLFYCIDDMQIMIWQLVEDMNGVKLLGLMVEYSQQLYSFVFMWYFVDGEVEMIVLD